jgi:hypothetical protein
VANIDAARDWLGNKRTNMLAWGLPHIIMVAGLLFAAPVRTVIWTIALAWMGAACILNSRRCRRTHCRFTGPYYLAMILPVLVAGSGIVPLTIYGWTALGAAILLGGGGRSAPGARSPSLRARLRCNRASGRSYGATAVAGP